MTAAADLSIVIVSYRTRELLDKCLASIFARPPKCSMQVIVVDNCSADGTAAMVREKFPAATLFDSVCNLGYSAGNNLGIRSATGRHILLLNPDTETNPEALDAMVDFLDSEPRAGAAGVQLLNTDGSLQESYFNIPLPLLRKLEGSAAHRRIAGAVLRLPPLGPASDRPRARRVDIVKGACLMIRREALDQVGPLDEDSFLYADDTDWCIRARKRGWSAYILEDCTIVHHGYASTDQETYLTITSSRRSALLLYRKHYPAPVFAAWRLFILGEIMYKHRLNKSRVDRGRADEKTKEKYRAYKTLYDELILKKKEL